jgi:putative ABC transport system permease protein
LILREAVALLSVGLAAGVLLSLASVKTVSSMLFGLQPYDPVTIGLAVAILAGVGLAASYLPARRAAGVDPMEALRAE